ncbi:G-alpha-domain-containing protein [Coprinopsis marcescibilis]|uniref:G-alpha-domain-containing protein n=1 Tax=Coprinopsis marcescibilis TaxID=230819 RepID=A0A5C3KPU1_COPMA|nr:G-alpha-domain-containing protein [Coprinopsis marcescibilis]
MLKSREKLAAVVASAPNPFLTKQWSGANPNETEEETQSRIRHMQEAQRISKEIDSSLMEARKAMEKRRKGVKILLLDVCVRGIEWKTLLARRTRPYPSQGPDTSGPGRRRSQSTINHENDPTSVLCAQRDEIIDLWRDPVVRDVLQKRGVYLEQMPGFFMNDIARIAVPSYLPHDGDIIRARIRTVGVEEHHFVVEKGVDANSDVYITDVGGSRSQRASWIPYFEDVQAILFLAPLAFNQTLQEAVKINRLEDSLHLWRDICSSKILAKANLILFFNKMDVLKATLAAGVLVRKYVPSYADQPNDVPSVTRYFKDRFKLIHKRFSPHPRPFMCYETSAIDINAMAVLLVGVRESILRQHLREGDMI